MSLILGIRCSDGIVMAASGLGAGPALNGGPPARQRGRALRVISAQAVLAVSGEDGVAQELALALEGALAGPDQPGSTELEFRTKLQEALAAPVQRAAAIRRTLAGLPGLGSPAGGHGLTQSLVGLPFGRAVRLYAFGADCDLAEITPEFPCEAIGPSAPVAQTFLRFLRRNLWGDGVPTTQQAEVGACWALAFADAEWLDGLARAQLVVMSSTARGAIDIAERSGENLAATRESVAEAERAFRECAGAGALAPDRERAPADQKPPRKRVPEVRFTLERPDARRGFAVG